MRRRVKFSAVTAATAFFGVNFCVPSFEAFSLCDVTALNYSLFFKEILNLVGDKKLGTDGDNCSTIENVLDFFLSFFKNLGRYSRDVSFFNDLDKACDVFFDVMRVVNFSVKKESEKDGINLLDDVSFSSIISKCGEPVQLQEKIIERKSFRNSILSDLRDLFEKNSDIWKVVNKYCEAGLLSNYSCNSDKGSNEKFLFANVFNEAFISVYHLLKSNTTDEKTRIVQDVRKVLFYLRKIRKDIANAYFCRFLKKVFSLNSDEKLLTNSVEENGFYLHFPTSSKEGVVKCHLFYDKTYNCWRFTCNNDNYRVKKIRVPGYFLKKIFKCIKADNLQKVFGKYYVTEWTIYLDTGGGGSCPRLHWNIEDVSMLNGAIKITFSCGFPDGSNEIFYRERQADNLFRSISASSKVRVFDMAWERFANIQEIENDERNFHEIDLMLNSKHTNEKKYELDFLVPLKKKSESNTQLFDLNFKNLGDKALVTFLSDSPQGIDIRNSLQKGNLVEVC